MQDHARLLQRFAGPVAGPLQLTKFFKATWQCKVDHFAHFAEISATISNDQLHARPLELQQLGHTSAAELFVPVLVVDLKS